VNQLTHRRIYFTAVSEAPDRSCSRRLDQTDWGPNLKAVLTRRDISYKDLAERLQRIGITDNEQNISNKISAGGFSATFLFQCMEAIGCRTIHLDRDD
jgi:Domain of unknown function (DUF6471)